MTRGHAFACKELMEKSQMIVIAEKLSGIDVSKALHIVVLILVSVMTTWLFCAANLNHVRAQSAPVPDASVLYRLSDHAASTDARLADHDRRLAACEITTVLAIRTDESLHTAEWILGALCSLILATVAILAYRTKPQPQNTP
jgi:hypothetical protein